MKIIRNLLVAVSLYSKIPVPVFKWEKDDMKYNLAFLPFVGIVIGGLEYLFLRFAFGAGFSVIFMTAISSAIPLIVTGGFHVDGFMDTQDAFKSYKSKEEKLIILKDPHIGAFAVISLLTYACIWAGALSAIVETRALTAAVMFAFVFVISRIATGISSIILPKAKKDGMLNEETKEAGKGALYALIAELVICIGVMFCFHLPLTVIMVLVTIGFFFCFRQKTSRELGGVTGDTAGYFLTVSELLMTVAMAVFFVF